MNFLRARWSNIVSASTLTILAVVSPAFAADGPKTPEEFAAQYMAAFNGKNLAAIKKLRYASKITSPLEEMRDEMIQAGMSDGTKYTKFELLPAPPQQGSMGPDGVFYQANLKITNLLKLSSVSKNGTSSEAFPIGVKDGTYYEVGVESDPGATPPFQFGWQRFTAPQSVWSVVLPNEPEPGRAALEKQFGRDALKDPDVYGVMKNTADIKTFQHWFRCGEEGKRVNDQNNKEIYRIAITTYTPETLKQWFSDAKKNLGDAVDNSVREHGGKLAQQKEIDFAGSPGIEFEAHDPDGTYHLGRVYWIKDALYELSFESKKEKPDRDGADKFLSSLQLQ